ncbi:hypothetical protein FHX80_111279 [Streptomyces brevispora]|uniref:Lipoprotein n=1 Tax=Streptomyces brevispora TaxID=887462 RepID=A0A561UU43_9ACTN|nr:hypothetical protein FHX80_111279 [Streptomyces brevispora]
MRFPRTINRFLLVSGLLALAACGGGGGDGKSNGGESSPDGLAVKGENPKILVHNRELAEDMLVGGRLEYIADGDCLVVHADQGGVEVTVSPIWSKDVRPAREGGKRGVEVPNFGTILEGATIKASGSFWEADDARMKDADIARACRPEGGFIVLNAGSFT